MNKKRILFLMIAFPDIRKSSNMYTDMVEEFANNGHDVFVATLNEDESKGTYIEKVNGITLLHIYVGKYFNTNFIRKGMTLLKIGPAFTKSILKHWGQMSFDMVLYPTPPITFQNIVGKLKKTMTFKSYLILRDIFPQNAKDLGLMKNPLLFKYFRFLESKLYKVSDYIGCMSPGNISYVLKHNPEVPKEKFELLPNWKRISEEAYAPVSREEKREILNKYSIPGDFVAIFGGVIGISQELSFVIELAEKCQGHKDVSFVLIGEGTEKEQLVEMVKSKNLTNVVFLSKIPRSDYITLVRCSDLGLVNLNRRFTIPNIPSKTMEYFEIGIPVLAAVDKNTDYGDFVLRSDAGLSCVTGDLETYYKNFLYYYNSSENRKAAGVKGRQRVESEFNVKSCYKVIAAHLEGMH